MKHKFYSQAGDSLLFEAEAVSDVKLQIINYLKQNPSDSISHQINGTLVGYFEMHDGIPSKCEIKGTKIIHTALIKYGLMDKSTGRYYNTLVGGWQGAVHSETLEYLNILLRIAPKRFEGCEIVEWL